MELFLSYLFTYLWKYLSEFFCIKKYVAQLKNIMKTIMTGLDVSFFVCTKIDF